MSGLVVPDAAEQAIISTYIGLVDSLGGHRAHLFTNDPTVGLTEDQIDQLTFGSFTLATFPGYALVGFTGGWSYVQGNPTVAVNTMRQFTRSSTGTPQSIRGYIITDASNALRWFELFDAPIVMEFINDRIDLTPRITSDDARGNAVEPGTIAMTGRATAPPGWLLCQGQAVSRSTFAALFAAIGTTYGTGDGSTTFNVPDLRQRFALGKAASGTGGTLGGTGGTVDHVHALDSASSHAKIIVGSASVDDMYSDFKTVTAWTATAIAAATALGTSTSVDRGSKLGGDTATANPPYQVVNYQIKT
jgi:microcystin-dependent protein